MIFLELGLFLCTPFGRTVRPAINQATDPIAPKIIITTIQAHFGRVLIDPSGDLATSKRA